MSAALKAILVLTALVGAPVGYVFYQAALSPDSWTYEGHSPANWKNDGVYHGASGPVAGTGLPFVALLGGGAYWLMRKARRRQAD